jgi:hypothetical protein
MKSEATESQHDNGLPDAVKTLVKALKSDPAYRYGWVANIAMAFQDEWIRAQKPTERTDIHTVANAAAENFLNILCMDPHSPEGTHDGV